MCDMPRMPLDCVALCLFVACVLTCILTGVMPWDKTDTEHCYTHKTLDVNGTHTGYIEKCEMVGNDYDAYSVGLVMIVVFAPAFYILFRW